MKVIYMGTPEFAVKPLEALIGSRHQVSLVVTQPDRLQGRGHKLVQSPVKETAEKNGLPVFQPEKLRAAESVARLAAETPDLIVVAAYGQILSEEVLKIPRYGCINIHGSLLPAYRGAAPIQRAVLNGEDYSGVTIMQMDRGLDTGDIILQEKVELAVDETAGSLYDKLSVAGSQLVLRAMDQIEDGTVVRTPQNNALASYAKKLEKTDGEIDWHQPAPVIERQIRGMNPWPTAYTEFRGKKLKIWAGDVVMEEEEGVPGSIGEVTKDYFDVICGEQVLRVRELQLEGRRRMSTHDFLVGTQPRPEEMLGQNTL